MQAQVMERWWLRSLPLISFLLIAALAAWAHVRRNGRFNHRDCSSWVAVAIGLPVLYTAGHFVLMVKLGPELGSSDVLRISIASFASPVFIFGTCIGFAVLASRGIVLAANAPPLPRTARYSAFIVAASVLLVASMGWRATWADVASRTAQWAAARQPHVSEQLLDEAIRIMPYERYYQRQLIFDLLARAVADIQQLGRTPDRYSMVDRNLAVATFQARETLKLFPRDAWSVLALANVLQVRALRFLRPLDPVAGESAAREANELFLLAHRMFPAQPLVLRNWAQLLFDQGSVQDAYRLLDLMEKLIPNELEPYYERMLMARQVNDITVISDLVARARSALEPRLFEQLLYVVKTQQN